ncbi:MAG: outer membrane lipoprotein-sorting protein [Spirochaetia bacterium]
MKRMILAALTLWFGASAYAESPQELLARIDAARYVADLSFVLQMTSFDGEKQLDSNILWGFVKGLGGENKSLIAFAEPASVRGRRMLMDGNIVYLLFPRTTNPIRLSPLQILMGEASNGDVVRTGFAQDYDAVSLEDTQRNGTACYLFSLSVKESRKDATYRKVQLWVEKDSLRPVYAEFSTGDRLLKQATYSDYRNALDRVIPFTVDIHDGENPQKHTVMTYLKLGRKPVADTVFRRDYLQSWTPEQPK